MQDNTNKDLTMRTFDVKANSINKIEALLLTGEDEGILFTVKDKTYFLRGSAEEVLSFSLSIQKTFDEDKDLK